MRLDSIRTPADLRDLELEELTGLAAEIRQRIVDTAVSYTHLTLPTILLV